MKRVCGFFIFIALLATLPSVAATASRSRPNIVYILCDDLGYGDIGAMSPNCRIATPNIDRLAAGGMRFTDAHSPSAVCTPTRYGILTGRYCWRSRLKSGVLGGLSPRLIEEGRLTVAELLRTNGYATACIGKWHLGMDWTTNGAVAELNIESREQVFNVDFTRPIRNGPLAVGFDEYFGISASLDMVPYTFIRNDQVSALPTEDRRLEMMTGRAGGFSRQGPAAPGFTGYEVLPGLAREAVEFIARRATAAKQGHPFFLYLPLTSPHTPILTNPEWRGRSGLNPYGDFVMETDHYVGLVLEELEKQGVAKDTLVIFTSDNGCSPSARFNELAAKGHRPSHLFRGSKADIFEGGHRIPFIARWPGRIKADTKSDQLLGLTDLMATVADLLGVKLPPNAGEDSVSFLPLLSGRSSNQSVRREAIVHHSINGSFAIRQGKWKLALTPDSGGWSAPRPNSPEASGLPPVQLYNLAVDTGETNNVQSRHPEVVSELTQLLEKYVAEGRSTPGVKQANTKPVTFWKSHREPASDRSKKNE
jgi:arylsulfatase A-like enzyme